MSIYQNVLVPIDFSVDSKAAIEKALTLANPASITLFHVVEDKRLAMPGDHFGLEAREELLAQGREVMRKFQAEHRLPQLAAETKAGNPADVICETAKEKGCDLIVMPRHGQSRIERFLLGSVTTKVMETAPCAVLVLHHEE